MKEERVVDDPPGPRSTPASRAIPRRISPPMTVAVLANLKKNYPHSEHGPSDDAVEYDREETVEAICAALQEAGHTATFLEGDESLVDTLRSLRPDFGFNICEGRRGDSREAQIPALLEMLGIPYTCSRVLANAISLDKMITKRIWRDRGLPTVPFQVFSESAAPLRSTLRFPLFAKPIREGSGKGVGPGSVLRTEPELRERVEHILTAYRQPALVESYLPGREFTVGILGNPGSTEHRSNPDLYEKDGFHYFPVLEIDPTVGTGRGVYGAEAKLITPGEEGAPLYLCPADIPPQLQKEMYRLTRSAFLAIGSADCSRVDFRLDAEGHPNLVEINTLPGLNPEVSDMCIISTAEGMHYAVLINEILNLAIERHGMLV